jgi:hypothetical protein
VDKRIPSRIFFDPVALEQASNIIIHHKGPRDAVIGAGARKKRLAETTKNGQPGREIPEVVGSPPL